MNTITRSSVLKPLQNGRTIVVSLLMIFLVGLTSCRSNPATSEPSIISGSEGTQISTVVTNTSESSVTEVTTENSTEVESMRLKIGDSEVPVIWEDNVSVEELRNLAVDGLTVGMSMYGGFEQVGSIGRSIARNDEQTTTSPGDIVLYSGDQIVIFYGSNSWAYTRLGRIDLSEADMTDLLGNGDVTVEIYID